MKKYAKDIAKELGVSTAAISLAINNKPGISEKKRLEIIDKIKEMGCDHLLKEDTTEKGSIGLVIYKTVHRVIEEFPFFSYLVEHINLTLQKNGYTMNFVYLTSQMNYDEQKEILLSSHNVGYLVYAVEMSSKNLSLFTNTSLPVVFIDNPFFDEDVNCLYVDSLPGIHQAMQSLYKLGHRKIGYIKSKIGLTCFQERFDAYKKSLAKHNLKFSSSYIAAVGYKENDSRADMLYYANHTSEMPTAFLSDNDLLACGAVRGLKEAGYKIPEDISIVGFDNRPLSEYAAPALSTITMPKHIMGKAAAELLIKNIEDSQNRKMHVRIAVLTEFISRESIGHVKYPI